MECSQGEETVIPADDEVGVTIQRAGEACVVVGIVRNGVDVTRHFRKQTGWILLCGVSVAGCATPYQAQGFQGGYAEARLDARTFRISFEGNVGLDRKTLEASLLRRAAELTLRQGFTHFAIEDRGRRTDVGFVMRPGVLGPTRRAERSIVIRCFAGDPDRQEVFEAKRLVAPEREAGMAPSPDGA